MKKINVPFSTEEVDRLLDSDLFPKDYEGVLQKTIISLMYYTGLRRMELIELEDTSVDFQNKSIKVLGKRNKERMIPLLPEAIEIMKYYISCKKELSHSLPSYFFCSSNGLKLTEGFVYQTVNHYLNSTNHYPIPLCEYYMVHLSLSHTVCLQSKPSE